MGEMTQAGTQTRKSVEELRNAAERKATERFGERKSTAAREVFGVARALRRTADELEQQNQETIAGYARRAADVVERVGGSLERKNASEIVGDIERVCRQHPAAVGVGAALVGFLGARVLRGASRRGDDGRPADADIEPPVTGGQGNVS
jgi:hypothetical protein